MRISDWSSDVCSSDLVALFLLKRIKGFQRTIEFRVERWHGLFKFIFRNNGLRRRLRRRHLLRTRQSSRTCDPKKSECQRSEENTSELQSLMSTSYDVLCLKKKNKRPLTNTKHIQR